MAETSESNFHPTSAESAESDCTLASNVLSSSNTSNNGTSDLTESELLDLLDSELNDEVVADRGNGVEHESRPMENGLDNLVDATGKCASEAEDAELNVQGTIGDSETNGADAGAIQDLTEADSTESAVANNASSCGTTGGDLSLTSTDAGEDDSIEADAYKAAEQVIDISTGSEEANCVWDGPESDSQVSAPSSHLDSVESLNQPAAATGSAPDLESLQEAASLQVLSPDPVQSLPEAESALSVELRPVESEDQAMVNDDGLEVDLSEVPEDDMDTMQRQTLDSACVLSTVPEQDRDSGPSRVPSASPDLSQNDAPESELPQCFSETGHASDPATPPTNPTAAQDGEWDTGGDVAESPSSTESMTNAPEDEQIIMQNVVAMVTTDGGEATPGDDVIPCGEECPEEDQFVNPREDGANEREAGLSDQPEVEPSTSGHRGSSDDELLLVEADLAVRRHQVEEPTSEVASQPSVQSSTEQCFEPECDQSGKKNGNPDLTLPALVVRTQNPTSLGSLESIELSSTKEEEFGDFVQSEPSSPQHSASDSPAEPQHKTLLALADESKLDPSKLNPDELIQISRRSSNQSLDSYDVMARSLESEEDDDVITVTSYRELLKRYTQLREQKENGRGSPPTPPSLSLTDLQTELDVLRVSVDQKQQELTKVQEKLEHHDEAAKRTICQLQTEMKTRVDQVTKMYDDVLSEKDSMVVKFAQQELKNTEIIRKQEAMEARFRDMAKDREVLVAKLKGAGVDKSKLSAQLHSKHGELINAQKDIHKFKDALSSQDVKVKWAHNKLKNEMEGHKETKTALERTMNKLKEAREETETIRRNCQQMIKTYQDSEDIKSNSLDQKLKEKVAQMRQDQQQRRDQDEVHQMVVNELELLKRKHKDALEEIQSSKDKLICMDQERSTQEKCITTYRDSLQLTKRENEGMASRLGELENISDERDRAITECEEMRQEMEEIRQQDKEYAMEAENCRARETQLLELTEKLTNKNALLQSENTSLNTKNSSALSELEHLKNTLNETSKNCKRLKEDLHDQQIKAKEDIDKLTKSLNDKTRLSEELKRTVGDKTDEVKVIKRRQAAAIKDLTRQLQQAKRRCEAQETPASDKADSLGSRTSSSNSLDTMSPSANQDQGDVAYSGSDTPMQTEMSSMAETPVVRHVEPDKQMLIERIVKLQRINARKSEKIEFLEDHINQLLLEIKKKNRLIQHYVLREESGALASNTSDNVKSNSQAQMSKKGGIMASLYSSHSSDQTMTLDLSLQINSKLQAVLEDTLLKNITLKENIDTLGAEIARLSQENRRLQLKTVPAS